ncbi:MAG: hypothetical protein VB086_02375 [Clostridiaceae bacterium]|nr:hypothetical protein [Clostridiaceae bacterium]
MKKYELLLELLPVIYPVFYVKKDRDGHELVFLDAGHHQEDISVVIADKTQCEAVENHFHLFNRTNEENKEAVKKIGASIAKNLLRALMQTFPDKKFIVYLEVNISDSTIVRFHQIWDNEPPYFDVATFKNKNVELFEFKA